MIEPDPVHDYERLARFVIFSGWIRGNGSVRPDAFDPPPDLNLSVTRHAALSQAELWQRGFNVAAARKKPLLGRADLMTASARQASLNVVKWPLPENPEHAHIIGWPADKPARKIAAQILAAHSAYETAPPRS